KVIEITEVAEPEVHASRPGRLELAEALDQQLRRTDHSRLARRQRAARLVQVLRSATGLGVGATAGDGYARREAHRRAHATQPVARLSDRVEAVTSLPWGQEDGVVLVRVPSGQFRGPPEPSPADDDRRPRLLDRLGQR